MTNAKNKKSVIALIVMALLLVASIALAATGAWFTDKAKGDGNATITFGKVDVNVEGTATLTKSHTANLTVDGCSWEITGLTMTNSSTVDIYYAYSVSVEITGLEDAEKAYFTIPEGSSLDCAKLTAGTAPAEVGELKVEFDSDGAMNGSEKTATITVTVKIAAIQADHLTETEAKTELATLLAAA